MTAQTPPAAATSPFKFLDAYGAQDSAVFFGRDDEIEALYRLLGESRLVLVYGQSGTGKTSLVQSGLTKKFSPTNWLPITVRRGDDLGAALGQALAATAITPVAPGATVVEGIRSVFLDHLRPVFLIFDQFEELYVLGSKAEQATFYTAIKAVLDADVSCRVIVLLREEYLAALDPFERAVPRLFDKRLRVEVMTNSNVEKVILGTTQAHGIALEHGADTARLIIDQLDDKRIGVQLAYLQVYLDHLYRRAARGGGGTIMFTDAEIAEAGQLGDIMAGFLDEQEQAIEAALAAQGAAAPPGGIARLLEEFVSAEGTKQPSTYDQVLARIPSAKPWLQAGLDLLQSSRLLRQVDGHYELAHDALAGRIAERRSGERKQLLMVEKLVQNRVAEFAQTRTLLNPEELALVSQAGRLVDPLDGSMLLRLDAAASQFVKQSRSTNRRRRFGRIGLLFAAILVPALLVLWNMAKSQENEDARINASNVADVIGFGTYQRTSPIQNEAAKGVAKWAHDTVQTANTNRDFNDADFTDEEGKKSFWWRLYEADTKFGGTNDAAGVDEFRKLEREQRGAYAENPYVVATLGKLKAVLWHHYFWKSWPDPVIGAKLFDLLETEIKTNDNDPLGFKDDRIEVCSQPTTPKVLIDKCKPYRAEDAGKAVEALATEPPAAARAPPHIN